jgi:hypothetical protein
LAFRSLSSCRCSNLLILLFNKALWFSNFRPRANCFFSFGRKGFPSTRFGLRYFRNPPFSLTAWQRAAHPTLSLSPRLLPNIWPCFYRVIESEILGRDFAAMIYFWWAVGLRYFFLVIG